jgi:tetratricopeptide (TPR) repeat protein
MCSHLGRLDEARRLIREAGELANRTGATSFGAFWSIYDGFLQDWTAHYDNALGQLRNWDEVASSTLFTLAYNRWCQGLCLAGKGAYTAALDLLQELLATCQRAGEAVFESRILNTMGWINVDLHNYERAVELNTRGITTTQAIGAPDPEIEFNARINLGDALRELGRLEEADEQFARVEAIVRDPKPEERWMLWRYAQHLLHSRGELFLRQGDADRALAYATDCLERATATDSTKNVVKSKRLQAQALLALDRLNEAEEAITVALEVAREVGNPPQLWKTLVVLGELRQAQNRTDEAREAYRDALAIVDGVASALEAGPVRETFLASPYVTQLRGLATVADPGAAVQAQ